MAGACQVPARLTPVCVCHSVKYSGMLEADPFPSGGGTHTGTTADYFFMLVIGGIVMFVRLLNRGSRTGAPQTFV